MEDETDTNKDESYEENPDYDNIRSKCDELVTSESISKEESLGILKLFHASEKKYLEMLFMKQKEIDSLNNELAIVKLMSKETDVVQQIKMDLSTNEKKCQELASELTSLTSQVQHITTSYKKK